ncbi:MAG TPA: diadenylate cyclase [Dissulfurispiraceae bacterium]|nr:diadenylate cyclase [Dissulfurispiraceae bacterium]
MKDQKSSVISNALNIARETGSEKLFLFLNSEQECRWFAKSAFKDAGTIVVVIPADIELKAADQSAPYPVISSWSGNQSRFSRIKYAFLRGVMQGIIGPDSKVVCVLGPHGKTHLDTITIHDLGLSWSEDFPFDVKAIIHNRAFYTIMAVVDIALDIGALGREGKSVGTIFVIGDTDSVMDMSHQVVFNPFRDYPKEERLITLMEVVESIKELAKLDGAIIISEDGVVEAAGRFLEASGVVTKKLRGLGARHRSAAGITRKTEAVAIVVSESTGRVTIFQKGRMIAALEPVISRRME